MIQPVNNYYFTIPLNSETTIVTKKNKTTITSVSLPVSQTTPVVNPQVDQTTPVVNPQVVQSAPVVNPQNNRNNNSILRRLFNNNNLLRCLDINKTEIDALSILKLSDINRFKEIFNHCTSNMSSSEKKNLSQRISRRCNPERFRIYSMNSYRNRRERVREREVPN